MFKLARCFVVAAPFLAGGSAFGQFSAAPSTTDVLDVSQGVTITDFTAGILPGPEAVFGADLGGAEPGTAFAPDVNAPNSVFIDLQTRERTALRGIRLYAKNDGSVGAFKRSMRAFRLFADVDGDGSFETAITDTPIAVDYSSQPGNEAQGNFLELTIAFATVVAQNWRVEFEQGVNFGRFDGVRIIEVDGITDVFDVSEGATVTDSTPGFVPGPEAVFGADLGGAEPGTAFAPDVGRGNSSFIALQTSGPSTLIGIRLFAKNDGGTVGFKRSMRAFRLFADVDGDGSFETVVTDTAIDVDYRDQPGNVAQGNFLDLEIRFDPIRAAHWRVEFEQGVNVGSFDSVRIIEVDAISSDCPGDVDGSGATDLSDLAVVLSAFASITGDPTFVAEADFDGDGDVDLSDLAVLLGGFGCGL